MAGRSDLARHRAERGGKPSNSRSEIIDAAEALFLERGIAATTATDIAQRAGVSRATLYRYFEGRDELAFAVAERMIRKLATKARQAVPAGAGPIAAARASLGALITHFEHDRDAHMYLAVLDSYRPFHSISEEYTRRHTFHSRKALHLDGHPASNSFDDDTAERLVTLTNILMGVLGRYAIKGDTFDRPVAMDTQLRHLEVLVANYFDTILAPQAKPPAQAPRLT